MSVEEIISVHEEIFKNLEPRQSKSTVTNAVLKFYLATANVRRMRITKRELLNIKMNHLKSMRK